MTEMTGRITNSADFDGLRPAMSHSMHLSIRAAVIDQIKLVAAEQEKRLGPLVDDMALLDSGLDSLSFAIIVARLESSLGIDPFSTADDHDFPVTLGEFIKFYEDAEM